MYSIPEKTAFLFVTTEALPFADGGPGHRVHSVGRWIVEACQKGPERTGFKPKKE
jgi:hypothetical protein